MSSRIRAAYMGYITYNLLLDWLRAALATNTSDFETVAVIDHSRLAEKEGVPMPPAVVTLYSKHSVNTALMKLNPRVGLDLPQKVLVFEEAGKPMLSGNKTRSALALFCASRSLVGAPGFITSVGTY